MISIDLANEADLPLVQSLVTAAGLPLDGLGEAPTTTLVARDDGEVVGTASLEEHGGHGLLRSVAVREDRRSQGLGSRLAASAEEHAAAAGLDGVYLLTDTAEEFFAGRGYQVIGRTAGPAAVMASVEWSVACGESAVPMVLFQNPRANPST